MIHTPFKSKHVLKIVYIYGKIVFYHVRLCREYRNMAKMEELFTWFSFISLSVLLAQHLEYQARSKTL